MTLSVNSANTNMDIFGKNKQQTNVKSDNPNNFTPEPIGVVSPPVQKIDRSIQSKVKPTGQEQVKVTLNIEPKKPKKSLTIFKVLNFVIMAVASVLVASFCVKGVKKLIGHIRRP
jgi:hypothetical protein